MGRSSIKAIIFDMDGVILDSEDSIRKAEVETFRKFGIPATIKLVSEYTGVRLDEEVADINRRFGVSLSAEKVKLVQDQSMEHYYRETVPLVPHIKETLNSLSLHFKLGLATMKDKKLANFALQRFKLLSFFKALTFGEDVREGKPNPEAFLRTAKLLNIDPKECAAVEDSNPGFLAGKAAGMLVIARRARHNRDTDFSPADFIVEDVREIPTLQVLRVLDKF